jgi:hypothetical protein
VDLVVLAECHALVQRCRTLCIAAVQRRFYGPDERFLPSLRSLLPPYRNPAEPADAAVVGAAVAVAGGGGGGAAWPADHFAGDVASHLMLAGALTSVLLLRRAAGSGGGGLGLLGLEAGVLLLFVADEAADMVFAGAGPAARTLVGVLENGLREYFAIPGCVSAVIDG